MAKLKVTTLPSGQLRISVVEIMGGAEVETLLDGVTYLKLEAVPDGSMLTMQMNPAAVIFATERADTADAGQTQDEGSNEGATGRPN